MIMIIIIISMIITIMTFIEHKHHIGNTKYDYDISRSSSPMTYILSRGVAQQQMTPGALSTRWT
jgi:hypothetical protein